MTVPHSAFRDERWPLVAGDSLLTAQRLVDVLPSAAYVCDADGIVLSYNRRAAELWGRQPEPGDPQVRFCGSWRLYSPGGRLIPHPECPMASVLRTGEPVHDTEVVLERPDGSRVVALVNIGALFDGAGGIVGAINTFSDITGRQTTPPALNAMQPAQDLLQKLPVAVYTTDAEGRITFYNDAAAALWGRRPTLGATEWCGSWRLFRPDGTPLPHDECPMAQSMREDRELHGAVAVAERPDGSRVPFLAHPVLLRNMDGTLIGALNTLVDISWRARGEALERRLAAIVESTDDAILSVDLGGIVASWNRGAEELYGYGASEMVGQPVTRLIPAERQGEEEDILDRVRRGERVPSYETVRRRKDGSMVDVALTASPLTNAAGQVVGASKIARDISERRRTQERQRLLLRELNHRVKNLFAVARGVVALSTRYANTPQDLAAAVQDRLAALSRAHELTLPVFAEDGEMQVRSASLAELIGTILSPYLAPDTDGRGRIAFDGPGQPISGGALTSLAMLLHECATNAAKHGALSCPDGRLDISWRHDGSMLSLTWQESGGPPVPEQTPGEGFGSYLARGTVEGQLGGRITRHWEPAGLRLHLDVPLQRLSQ